MSNISNNIHKVLGQAKESLGKAVGSEQLIASGHAEAAEAEARAAHKHAEDEANKAGERLKGTADEVSGRVKSTIGAATGNAKLQAEGNLQETAGQVRNAINK
ncbi:hypothetical protein BGZ94_002687 [Podila epigama]|nr:hypothetical protein BGZ94_002687 [Podila epigama]